MAFQCSECCVYTYKDEKRLFYCVSKRKSLAAQKSILYINNICSLGHQWTIIQKVEKITLYSVGKLLISPKITVTIKVD